MYGESERNQARNRPESFRSNQRELSLIATRIIFNYEHHMPTNKYRAGSCQNKIKIKINMTASKKIKKIMTANKKNINWSLPMLVNTSENVSIYKHCNDYSLNMFSLKANFLHCTFCELRESCCSFFSGIFSVTIFCVYI